MTTPIVELKNISKHFGSIIALSDISFDIKPSEVHCLLGDSGAGKSTFTRTISGYHSPTSGQMFFDGNEVRLTSPGMALDMSIAIIFISHNVRHAYAVGNRFTVLYRGQTMGTFAKEESNTSEFQEMMQAEKLYKTWAKNGTALFSMATHGRNRVIWVCMRG